MTPSNYRALSPMFSRKFKKIILKIYENHFKIPTADLPSVYNWDEYFIKKIWENFRWKYKDDDGKYKDLPGRKSNGEWPCINEYILDHWLTGGKIEDKCCWIISFFQIHAIFKTTSSLRMLRQIILWSPMKLQTPSNSPTKKLRWNNFTWLSDVVTVMLLEMFCCRIIIFMTIFNMLVTFSMQNIGNQHLKLVTIISCHEHRCGIRLLKLKSDF